MLYYEDLNTETLLARAGQTSGLSSLSMGRGNVTFGVQFCQGSTLCAAPTGTTAVWFGLKAQSNMQGPWLANAQLAPIAGSAGLYQAILQLNTPELIALMHAAPTDPVPELLSVPVYGQFYYFLPGQTDPNASQVITVNVTAVLWNGAEGIAPSPNVPYPPAAAVATKLAPTAVETAPYTAAPGDLVQASATVGNVPITLPTAPADGSQVAVKLVAVAGSYTASVTCGGADVLDLTGGSTSIMLSLAHEGIILQYVAATAVWIIIEHGYSLMSLDARYVQSGGTATLAGLNLTPLPAPGRPTATTATAGPTLWLYNIVARANNGTTTTASLSGSCSGPSALSAASPIQVNWPPVAGTGVSYDVYRSQGGGTPGTPSGQGRIATALTATTLTDTGLPTDGTNVPTVNGTNTGILSVVKGASAILPFLPVAQGGTGANTAAGARANLGLGNASTLGVGTTAGTVANGVTGKSATEGNLLTIRSLVNLTDAFSTANAGGNFALSSLGQITGSGGAAGFTQYLQLSGVTVRENFTASVTFAVTTITGSSDGCGFSVRSINPYVTPANFSVLAQCSGGTPNAVYIFLGNNQLANSAEGTMSVAANDLIRLTFSRRANILTAQMENLTQGLSRSVSITLAMPTSTALGSTVPNIMLPNTSVLTLNNYSGSYVVGEIKVDSQSLIAPDLLCIGDSQTTGYASGFPAARWADRVAFATGLAVRVEAGPGDRTVEVLQSVPLLRVAPKRVVMLLGINDVGSGIAAATYEANYQSIATAVQGWGASLCHILPLPNTQGINTAPLRAWILATYPGATIDPSAGWNTATMTSADGIHPTAAGHQYIANLVTAYLQANP